MPKLWSYRPKYISYYIKILLSHFQGFVLTCRRGRVGNTAGSQTEGPAEGLMVRPWLVTAGLSRYIKVELGEQAYGLQTPKT